MSTNANDNKNYIFSYDHLTTDISANYDTNSTDPGADDLHSHGSIFITNLGTIIVATVSRGSAIGGDSGILFSRAVNADITNFTPIAGGEVDSPDCQYVEISQVTSGRIFAWYRKNHGKANIVYSDDDGATWSTPVTFFDFANGLKEWMYPSSPPHNKMGSDIHIVISRRNYLDHPTPSTYFPERYYLKTSDGITFSNIADTWSKDVVTNGFITTAEIDTNALIEKASIQETFIWNNAGCIGSDGIPYLLSEKEGGGLNFSFWSGSAWVIREVITNNTILYGTSRNGIYHISGDTFLIWTMEPVAGIDQVTSYRTTDKGLTWSFEEQVTDTNEHYFRADLTDNMQDHKQGLIATIKGDGTGTNAEIFIKALNLT